MAHRFVTVLEARQIVALDQWPPALPARVDFPEAGRPVSHMVTPHSLDARVTENYNTP
jgi:hypothetical protein